MPTRVVEVGSRRAQNRAERHAHGGVNVLGDCFSFDLRPLADRGLDIAIKTPAAHRETGRELFGPGPPPAGLNTNYHPCSRKCTKYPSFALFQFARALSRLILGRGSSPRSSDVRTIVASNRTADSCSL